MSKIQELIEAVLNGLPDADGDGGASRVYRDEPILFTAAQMKNVTPAKYRQMRRLAQGLGYGSVSDADVFYRQAKFMEEFEDTFDYHGDFTRYYPTYQSMSDLELRGYFSWRTQVRRGLVEKTSLSFVFVYVYELLNQIGVRNPEEGFHALQNFWRAYGVYDSRPDPYLRAWLRDYVVYYDLDRSLLGSCSGEQSEDALLTVLEFKLRGRDEVCAALSSLSTYNLENSKFYKLHPYEMNDVVYSVFSSLAEFYEKNRKNNVLQRLFGRISEQPYTMFKSAVFCHRIKRKDFVYEVNAICKYRCRNGNWTCERFFGRRDKNKLVGALLKNTDYLMRQKYGFKSALKPAETTKLIWSVIQREVDQYHGREPENPAKRIEIDLSKLQDIRRDSLETQDKLIVDGGPENALEEREEVRETPPPASADGAGLSEAETRFLRCLMDRKPYDGLLKSQNLLLSVLVDSINETLFERFGDTVIEFESDQPELIADYIDELKGIVME